MGEVHKIIVKIECETDPHWDLLDARTLAKLVRASWRHNITVTDITSEVEAMAKKTTQEGEI